MQMSQAAQINVVKQVVTVWHGYFAWWSGQVMIYRPYIV